MVSAQLFLSRTQLGGLGDIVELATAVLWDASTGKGAFRRRKAKRRSLGHGRSQGAGQAHKDCSACVSSELE